MSVSVKNVSRNGESIWRFLPECSVTMVLIVRQCLARLGSWTRPRAPLRFASRIARGPQTVQGVTGKGKECHLVKPLGDVSDLIFVCVASGVSRNKESLNHGPITTPLWSEIIQEFRKKLLGNYWLLEKANKEEYASISVSSYIRNFHKTLKLIATFLRRSTWPSNNKSISPS